VIVKVCDYCGEDIAYGEECAKVTFDNFYGDGGQHGGHYHIEPHECAQKVADTLLMLRDLGGAVEGIPVASPQRIGALRRKHTRPEG